MPSYGLGRTDSAFDFKLPSGNTCRMKHADLQALIGSGLVDSLDTLTALVQTEHVDRVKKGKKGTKTRHVQEPGTGSALAGLPPEAQAVLSIMKDKERWSRLEGIINGVVVQCVLEPEVVPAREEGEEYPPEYAAAIMAGTAFSVTDVALMDRMSIFAEAMRPLMVGQSAMTPFRDGPQTSVASVGSEQGIRDEAEPGVGDS